MGRASGPPRPLRQDRRLYRRAGAGQRPPPMEQADLDEARAWRIAVTFVAVLTILRLAVLFATPLELYPDEAQYWLWSRALGFGYFSKPPMIAWLIAATTTLGNDEAFVRLAAPLLNAGTALALYGVSKQLYGTRTGLVACAIY